ncbi:hypothetical protein PENSPDRAFT_750023 [Peniophora sp. CONT]|nr:hypothetical protein PENSPDRAFT_750023 [Peniophora sp. CONT]
MTGDGSGIIDLSERPAKRQRFMQPVCSPIMNGSPSGSGRRTKPGPSRSSVGLDLTRITIDIDAACESDTSTTMTLPQAAQDALIQATVDLSNTLGDHTKDAPSAASSNRLSYASLLYQRDVILRGFNASQELRARESQQSAPQSSSARLREDLTETRNKFKQALAEREDVLNQQHSLECQLESVQDNNDALNGDLTAALLALQAKQDELEAALASRDSSQLQCQTVRKELGDTKAALLVMQEELAGVRVELEARQANDNLAQNVRQHTIDAEQSAAMLSSSSLDDPLMAELEASLDAVKHEASQREEKLAQMAELEVRVATLEAERKELLGWKQRTITLEEDVEARKADAIEWQRRYEARGERLTTAIREMNELRARVG